MNQNTTIIELKNITKVYRQGELDVHALRGLDLTIKTGEFTAISGPSGSGKTTALNLIGALDKPTSGDIHLEGNDLKAMGQRALSHLRRDRIGFVFQAYNLMPILTAYENAETVLALQGVAAQKRKEIVMKLLEDVGLEGMADRRPNQLSGGQQQRVAIARAMASRPAVILADEPTANVDSETASRLLDLMKKLNEEHGTTFVFSTHDPRVMESAKRLIRLVDGKVEDEQEHP
ncbi:MAG: ABC transporter ATP-binding protein [Myxococcota bacterium]|nr:ABC transporter ATP-binding protein [Myxococcota bacterium]